MIDIIETLLPGVLAPTGNPKVIERIVALAKKEAEEAPVIDFVESRKGDGWAIGGVHPYNGAARIFAMFWEEPPDEAPHNGRVFVFSRVETKDDQGQEGVLFKGDVLFDPAHVSRVMAGPVVLAELLTFLSPDEGEGEGKSNGAAARA